MTNEEAIKVEQESRYFLQNFKKEEGIPPNTQEVKFYKKDKEGNYVDGTTVEEMLRVSFERLTHLNNIFCCEENINALSHIGSAIEFLNKRTEDREERGVEGKHEA